MPAADLAALNYLPEYPALRKGEILIIPARSAVSVLSDPALLLEDGYLVQSGDELSVITALFSTDEKSLLRANGRYISESLEEGLIIHLGRMINLGYRNGYIVQKGDTLSRIAGKFSVARDEIIAINDLPDPDCLVQGQILILP